MGWWRIKDDAQNIVIGDQSVAVMGQAVEKIVDLYEETWGTKPSLAELEACLKFCASSLLDKKPEFKQ